MMYVGDLSRQDVQVLASLSRTASAILEFGSGASTQILAQSAPSIAEITSVDTEPAWLDRTAAVLTALGASGRVRFVTWDQWNASLGMPRVKYDVIFNDGLDQLRLSFALASWTNLKIGGALVFHDTRRAADIERVFAFCSRNFLSVDKILLNIRASNMTIVTKKIEEPYQNWNVVEQRAPWMIGMTPVEEAIMKIQELQACGERFGG